METTCWLALTNLLSFQLLKAWTAFKYLQDFDGNINIESLEDTDHQSSLSKQKCLLKHLFPIVFLYLFVFLGQSLKTSPMERCMMDGAGLVKT